MKLYLCEKPSQAADIARELGNPRKTGSHYETSAGCVTWAYGHLLELNEPDDYGDEFKKWNFDQLPILPSPFKVSPKESGKQQLTAISKLLKEANEVIISTDADREGEMIGREILDFCKYRGPVKRLWLSALDPASIQKGLANLKPGTDTETLYHAALGRSQADWLVGMNMTRALTVRCRKPNEKGVLSIGRVQTPTLALVVRRDREIAHFKPKDYFEIAAHTEAQGHRFVLRYAPRDEERILDRTVAQAIADKATGAKGPLKVEKTPKKTAPPRLFALSGFQKESNARFGWGADKALSIAQALYEKHKVTTYPRTDCDYLPDEQKPDVPIIVKNLSSLSGSIGAAATLLKNANPSPLLRSNVFDSAKVTAHHAIIPTKLHPEDALKTMTADEKSGFLLIAGRYLENLFPDYEYLQTKLSLKAAEKLFGATGSTPTKQGWKVVAAVPVSDDDEAAEEPTLPELADGVAAEIKKADVQAKKTQPPKPYTEGTLLDDMRTIAKFVTDPAKKARLKDTSGIGTEATRANIIAKLCSRNDKGEIYPNASPFLETKKGKGKAAQIVSTQKGKEFIVLLEAHLPALADPGETAIWEEGLEDIAGRKLKTHEFVDQIGTQIRSYLKLLEKAVPMAAPSTLSVRPSSDTDVKCHKSGKPVTDHGEYWCFPGYPGFYARKVFMKREMTIDDYNAILSSAEGVTYTDLVSGAGKKFSAQLQFSTKTKFNGKPGLEMSFA